MKNILIEGNIGTGKTMLARSMAYYHCVEHLSLEESFKKDSSSDLINIEKFIESERCEFIQVHPSMSYEDMVYGLEINNNQGNLEVSYVEKKVKKICDRALVNSQDLHCIIIDDIYRTQSSTLLGNLLYGLEYRNQSISLANNEAIKIPNNVIFIFTECNGLNINKMDYALRRRFDYVKQLTPDREIIEEIYSGRLNNLVKDTILSIYDGIQNFIKLNFTGSNYKDFLLGHSMFMVNPNTIDELVLGKLKIKIKYNIIPYINNMFNTGLIKGDLEKLYHSMNNKINIGIATTTKIEKVEKIFIDSENIAPDFNLKQTKIYYENELVGTGFRNKRDVMECIIDTLLLNEILPLDIVLFNLLLNTDVAAVQSKLNNSEFAAYLVDTTNQHKYFYSTPKKKSIEKLKHWYYSKDKPPPRYQSRWAANGETIAYRVSYLSSTNTNTFIPINGFRVHSFTVKTNRIDTQNNAAEAYRAIYRLIEAYLNIYEVNIYLSMCRTQEYIDLINLIKIEKKYLELVALELKNPAIKGGDNKKWEIFGNNLLFIQTLWNKKDEVISVDKNAFNDLIDLLNSDQFIDADLYRNLYTCNSQDQIHIPLKGVLKMTDLKDYQSIMENIGVHQIIFQGPPGTSKTFESKKFVLEQLNPQSSILSQQVITQEEISNELESLKLYEEDYSNPHSSSKINSGGWDLVQFHPSYSYEDFIRGIDVKPSTTGIPVYETVNKILGKISEFSMIADNHAQQRSASPKFYLIIDEINRANLATVFGELIYGLEYRGSSVSTPYEVMDLSQRTVTKNIVLGKNLFIIGTMNTADKSIDAIDYAIRRRFLFIDSPANRDVVINCYQNIAAKSDEESIELILFDAIQRIFDDERFFNDEYQKNDVRLGHTYFLRKSQQNYCESIIEKIIFQVIPIMKEYLKDGILETTEKLFDLESSPSEIASLTNMDEKIEKISLNIMIFVKEFGNENKNGDLIDNEYIKIFIEELCSQLSY